jgi:hypothetical protein
VLTIPDGRDLFLIRSREDITRDQLEAREVLVHLDGTDGRSRVGGDIGAGEDRFHRGGLGLDLVFLIPLLECVLVVAYLTLKCTDCLFCCKFFPGCWSELVIIHQVIWSALDISIFKCTIIYVLLTFGICNLVILTQLLVHPECSCKYKQNPPREGEMNTTC